MSRMEEIMARRGPYHDPDPTPIEIPAWATKPLTMKEEMERFFRNKAAMEELDRLGIETEEEANDFDIDDSDELDFGISESEMIVMEQEYLAESALFEESGEAHSSAAPSDQDDSEENGSPPEPPASDGDLTLT
jgi:hypothetical protein